MRRSPLVIVAAAACVLALVGCSSDKKTEVDATASTGPATTPSTAASPPVSLSGSVTDKGTQDASGEGATPTLELGVDDNFFTPTFTKFAPGAVVTVQLKNDGTRTHTFTLEDGGVDQTLDAGQSAEVTVTVPATGSANFFCSIHQSTGMQGAFFTSASGSGSGGSGSGGSSSTTSSSATSSSTTRPVYGGY